MLLERHGRAYLSYADLIDLGSGAVSTDLESEMRREDLNRWYTTLDGFGVVVMMAATTFQ